MSHYKYKLNKESLNFEIVKTPLSHRTKRLLLLFIASVILSVVYTIIYISFFDSPKATLLKSRNANIKLKYNLLLKDIKNSSEVITAINNRDKNIYRAIFGMKEISYVSSRRLYDEEINLQDDISKIFTALNEYRHQIYVQSKSFDEVYEMARNKDKMVRCIPAIPPLDLRKVRNVGAFGIRFHPVHQEWRMHEGIDLSVDVGTPIYATGDGKVSKVEYLLSGGYGYSVDIDHGFGYLTRYAHLSRILVRPGMQVKRGDKIALSGNTGTSTGPHLHYEVRYMGKPLQPKKFYVDNRSDINYDNIVNQN